MPHVSRNKLSKKAERELTNTLNLALTKVTNGEDMQIFLDVLFTPTEKLMLAKRLAIIVLLKESFSDTQIADSLHLTRITVAKMRLFYELRGQGFEVALRKLQEQKEFEDFKKLLFSLARYTVRAAGGYVKPSILD